MKTITILSYIRLIVGIILLVIGAYLFVVNPGNPASRWLLIAGLISQIYFVAIHFAVKSKMQKQGQP